MNLSAAFHDHVYQRPEWSAADLSAWERFVGELLSAEGDDRDRLLYYAAQLRELQGDYAGAASLCDQMNLDCPGENIDRYDFEAYTQFAEGYQRATTSAKSAGRDRSVIIAALPKSASAFLAHGLSELLGTYRVRLGRGLWGAGTLVPRWVELAARNPVVPHEHTPATPHNLRVLAASGVTRMTVNVRHPADALASLFYYLAEKNQQNLFYLYARELGIPYFHFLSHTEKEQKDWLVRHVYPAFIRWIEAWMAAAGESALSVLFTRYEDLTEDMPGMFQKILAHAGYDPEGTESAWCSRDPLTAFLARFDADFRTRGSRSTFRAGGSGGYQTVFDAEQQAWMSGWDASPLFERFEYTPVRRVPEDACRQNGNSATYFEQESL